MRSQATGSREKLRHGRQRDDEENTQPRKRSNRAPETQGAPDVEPGADGEDDIVRMTQFYDTQFQASQSSKISKEESDHLVRAVMRHMLFKQFEKPDVPVTRAELTTIVQTNYKDHTGKRNIASGIIAKAQSLFPNSFGMELKEITRKSKAKGTLQGSDGGNKEYILRSLLPSKLLAQYVRPEAEDQSRGLLIVILALIKLNGDKITEEELFRLLEELGFSPDEPHPAFGKIQDVLEVFAKKRYLLKTQFTTPDGQMSRLYEFGENAEHEILPDIIEDFIHTEFGDGQ